MGQINRSCKERYNIIRSVENNKCNSVGTKNGSILHSRWWVLGSVLSVQTGHYSMTGWHVNRALEMETSHVKSWGADFQEEGRVTRLWGRSELPELKSDRGGMRGEGTAEAREAGRTHGTRVYRETLMESKWKSSSQRESMWLEVYKDDFAFCL